MPESAYERARRHSLSNGLQTISDSLVGKGFSSLTPAAQEIAMQPSYPYTKCTEPGCDVEYHEHSDKSHGVDPDA